MDATKKPEMPKTLSMKLSLKKESLRTLADSEVAQLDAVVGGTCNCTNADVN